jgi:hypothetical protein
MKTGDKVKYIGKFVKDFDGIWQIMEDGQCKCLKIGDKRSPMSLSGVGQITYFYNTSLKLLTEINEIKCTCFIINLMRYGCKCGQIEREKNE